jgi:hypothetical protein
MAATEQLRWRRAFPARAARRLVWFALGGGALAAAMWGLFGTEPQRLPSGESNPLAALPTVTLVLVGALAVPFALAVARRPVVAADHYALEVRPGAVRTLVLPWAQVVEIAGVPVGGEPLLLVRCTDRQRQLGDRPRWCDQGTLRASRRAAGAHRRAIEPYDLAVRIDEFAGDPAERLAALTALAPHHVVVTRSL